MGELKPLHPEAVGYSAFRVLKNGQERQYSAVEYPTWAAADQYRRKCKICGWLLDHDPEPYAILDVIAANGDIVDQYAVRDAAAWRHIKKDLQLTVVAPSEDDRPNLTEATR